jgi:hypothetical protein
VHCLNNIRQVDLLLLMYGHDNNDRLPSTTNILALPPPAVDAALRGGFSHQIFYDPARVEWARAHPFVGSGPGSSDPSQSWFDGTFSPSRQIGYLLTLPGIPYLIPTNVNATIVPQPVTKGAVVLPPPNTSQRVLVAGGTYGGIVYLNAHVDSMGFPLGDNVAMLDGSARWRKYKDMIPRMRDAAGVPADGGIRW